MKRFIGETLKESKPFAWFLVLVSLFGIGSILFQILGYDTFLRPYLFNVPEDILAVYPSAKCIYPHFTTNNVSGCNYLLYFTILSNLLTDLYLLALGLSILGVKWVQCVGFNKYLEGAVTMYISITGIIYCCAMLPFFNYDEIGWVYSIPGTGFYDFLGYWQHMILPIIMLVIWHLPFDNNKMSMKKFVPIAVTFPILYSVLTMFRGFFGAKYLVDAKNLVYQTWFPYPFLAPDRLAPYVGQVIGNPNPPETLVNGMTALCYIIVVLVFFGTPVLIALVHNKYLKSLNKKYCFKNSTQELSDEEKYV